MYEDDFITKFEEEFEIDGRKFTLKVMTGREKDKMIDEIMWIDPDRKVAQYSIEKKNAYYLGNCVLSIPYDLTDENILKKFRSVLSEVEIEEIKTKKWKQLSPKIREKILQLLPNKIRVGIIEKLTELNDAIELKKK